MAAFPLRATRASAQQVGNGYSYWMPTTNCFQVPLPSTKIWHGSIHTQQCWCNKCHGRTKATEIPGFFKSCAPKPFHSPPAPPFSPFGSIFT